LFEEETPKSFNEGAKNGWWIGLGLLALGESIVEAAKIMKGEELR